jgi:hypothetical protein
VAFVLLWLLRELPFVLTEVLLSEPVPVVVLVELCVPPWSLSRCMNEQPVKSAAAASNAISCFIFSFNPFVLISSPYSGSTLGYAPFDSMGATPLLGA